MISSRTIFQCFALISFLLGFAIFYLNRFHFESLSVVFLLNSSIVSFLLAFRLESTSLYRYARISSTIICFFVAPIFIVVSIVQLTNEKFLSTCSNSSVSMLFGNSFEMESASNPCFHPEFFRFHSFIQLILGLLMFFVHFVFVSFERSSLIDDDELICVK